MMSAWIHHTASAAKTVAGTAARVSAKATARARTCDTAPRHSTRPQYPPARPRGREQCLRSWTRHVPRRSMVSVVIPCLNEEQAVGGVVESAKLGLAARAIRAKSSWSTTARRTPPRLSPPSMGLASFANSCVDTGAPISPDLLAHGANSGHGGRGRHVSGQRSRAVRRAPRARRRPRDRLTLRRSDPPGRDAMDESVHREPHSHRDAEPPFRREGLGRALRNAGCTSGRAATPRPPLDRHGIRIGDGLQGIPPRPDRERDSDRVLPAYRRVEAPPFARCLAACPLHAPLQPQLALPLARRSPAPPRRLADGRARQRPGRRPRSHVADPHDAGVRSIDARRSTDRSARGLRAYVRAGADRRARPPPRSSRKTASSRARTG